MDEANNLYTVLKEIFLLLDDGDRRVLADFDLTVPRFYALLHLGDHPGLSISELSDLMFCDKSNITRLIKTLEADDLVYRRPHDSDGRVFCLHLTSRGEELREKVLAIHSQRNEMRFSNTLGSDERKALLFWLHAVKDSLQLDLEQY